MSHDRLRAYCRRCHHDQPFERRRANHLLHAVLTALTLGLWGISWLAVGCAQRFRPWRCRQCGWHDPEITTNEIRPPGEARWPADEPRGRRRSTRREPA